MRKNALSRASLNTRRLVVCAILSAMSTVILMIGGVTGILDLTAMVIASMCVAFAVIEISTHWAWLVWGVTSLLSLLIIPNREIAILYLLGGMYPIAKSAFERLRPLFAWPVKLSMFNSMLLIYILIAQKLLGLSGAGYDFTLFTFILGNASFLLYDFSLTVLISFYLIRLRRRLKFPALK